MRRLFLAGFLGVLLTGASAQGVVSPVVWDADPAAAEASARSLGKPVLLLWQAGPGAPLFTQGVERLFTSWPLWAGQASLTAVFTRARAWEAGLPPTYPILPEGGKTSALVLWDPGREPVVWTEVPPVLELSQRLAQVSGRVLEAPYTVLPTVYTWDTGTVERIGSGPWWAGTGPEGPSQWVEEGPVGTVLVLREPATGRRAAFPLEGEWSFLYDAVSQSWTPWTTVLVKAP